MATYYKAGETLQQIGNRYGITRERVRQLLSKIGIRRQDGGKARHSAEKRERYRWAVAARREARTVPNFGCTYTTARHLNGGRDLRKKGTPACCYQTQKHNAISARKIEWDLTFPEWLEIWEASGHLHERGLGRDKYCMARRGDTGAYTRDNAYITTCADNVRDYQGELKLRGVRCPDGYVRLPEKSHKCDGKPQPNRHGRGWTYRPHRNKRNPYQVVVGKKYIGVFPTQESARAAYLAASGTEHV